MWTSFRLKTRNFFRKHKMKVVLVAIIWVIVIAVNYFIANFDWETIPRTSYTPHESIMQTGQEVPARYTDQIEQKIYDYFTYCNNKEYEKAYNMIDPMCIEALNITPEVFIEYVNQMFDTKKAYSIQSYSTVGKVYIYRLRMFEDILATGMTNQEDFLYRDEKLSFYNDNGKLLMSINSFIASVKYNDFYEDEEFKIKIEKKLVYYDQEIYTVTISNKGDHTIVVKNNTVMEEVLIDIGNEKRSAEGGAIIPIIVYPGQTTTYQLKFAKFFDEPGASSKMIFNSIRIYEDYENDTTPVKSYGVEIPLV